MNETELDATAYYDMRQKAVQDLKDAGKHPYPHKFHVSLSLAAFIEKVIRTAGVDRVVSKLPPGLVRHLEGRRSIAG